MNLNKDQALNLVNAFKNVRKKEGESDLGHIRSTVSHNVSEEHRQGMLDQLKSYTHYHAHDLCHRIHTFWGRWQTDILLNLNKSYQKITMLV